MKILLIANGPAATARRIGEKIDAFNGDILRFNWYVTNGYSKYVGTRTDIWVTIDSYASLIVLPYKKVYHHDWRLIDGPTPALLLIRKYHPTAEGISVRSTERAKWLMDYHSPSTGAIAVTHLMDNNDLYLYGFDFFNQNVKHHYMHTRERGNYLRGTLHNSGKEEKFFTKLIDEGRISLWTP